MLISFNMLSTLIQYKQLQKVTITSFMPSAFNNNQAFISNLFLDSVQTKFNEDTSIAVLDVSSQEYNYIKNNMRVYNKEEYLAILSQFKSSIMSYGSNISFRDDNLLYKEYLKTIEILPSAGYVLIENSNYERISLGTNTVPNIPGTDGTKINIIQFAKMIRLLYPNLLLTFSNLHKLFMNYVENRCENITNFTQNLLIDRVTTLDDLSKFIDTLVVNSIGRNLTYDEVVSLLNGDNFNKAMLVNYYSYLLSSFKLMENQATELLLLHKPMKEAYINKIQSLIGLEGITRPVLFDPIDNTTSNIRSLDSLLSI